MMKKKIRFDRLKKLADHLIKGELGHDKFDFYTYNELFNGEYKRNGCGTIGCAIGECPIIFPKDWCFSKIIKDPKLRRVNHSCQIEQDSGMMFFGLTLEQYCHLFVPYHQSNVFGGKQLGRKATAKAVGNNILVFIKPK